MRQPTWKIGTRVDTGTFGLGTVIAVYKFAVDVRLDKVQMVFGRMSATCMDYKRNLKIIKN